MASCDMTAASTVAYAFHNLFEVEFEGVEFFSDSAFFADVLALYFETEISESIVKEACALIDFAPSASTTQEEFGVFVLQLQQLLVPAAAAAPHVPAAPAAVPSVTKTPCWQPPQDFQQLPSDEALAVHTAMASFSSNDAETLEAHIGALCAAHWDTLQPYAEATMRPAIEANWRAAQYWAHAVPMIRQLLEAKRPPVFEFIPAFDAARVPETDRLAVSAAISHIDSTERCAAFGQTIREARRRFEAERLQLVPAEFRGSLLFAFEQKEYFNLMVEFAGTQHLRTPGPGPSHGAALFLAAASPKSASPSARAPRSPPHAPAAAPVPAAPIASDDGPASPMERGLAKRQRLSATIASRVLAPVGSAVAQSVASLHLHPANVQSNRQLDARVLSRDNGVRQTVGKDGAPLSCYGMILMDNTAVIKFTAWGPSAASISETLGPVPDHGDGTLSVRLMNFNVQPTADPSFPRLSELRSVATTTVARLEEAQQSSAFFQDTAVLNLETLLTNYEVLSTATPRFVTHLHGVVRNARDVDDTATGRQQKVVELVDVAGNLVELRACGAIAGHEDWVPGARLAVFFVHALAARKAGYRGTFWVYDTSFLARLGTTAVIPNVHREIKL